MAKKSLESKNKEEKKTEDSKNLKKEMDLYFDEKKKEFDKNLSGMIDEQIQVKINKKMKEEEKRIIRFKNAKIIRRDILILILLAGLGYCFYCLYQIDYFHIRTKVIYKTQEVIKKEENPSKDNEQSEPVFNRDDYIKNYRYLVDQLQIDDEDVFLLYQKKLNTKNIPNQLLLKIAYKNLDENKKIEKDHMITFQNTDLEEVLNSIFGEQVLITHEVFIYNQTRFMNYNDMYLGYVEKGVESNLVYEIGDVAVHDNQIVFDVVVGKIKDDKLFNLKDEEVATNYQKEDGLINQRNLSTYQFTFIKDGEQYIFSSIYEK